MYRKLLSALFAIVVGSILPLCCFSAHRTGKMDAMDAHRVGSMRHFDAGNSSITGRVSFDAGRCGPLAVAVLSLPVRLPYLF